MHADPLAEVMFAGIDLPAAYLKREALSLFVLLLPIMTIAWFISAGFVLLFVPSLTFLEALAISACITPTDPILANTSASTPLCGGLRDDGAD